MPKIRAVIFDMDGVLIDAREWHYDALNRALELFGYTITRMEHLTTFDGLPTKKKLAMLSLERGLPKGLHEFINELKQIYTQEIVHQKCKPIFAHEYAIVKLKGMGYRVAVASNSVRASVELMLNKSRLLPHLDLILSNQDVAKPKPHPEIYSSSMQRLGMRPDECLVVEDNPHGIQAARDSGAYLMAVRSPEDVFLANILDRIRRIEGGMP